MPIDIQAPLLTSNPRLCNKSMRACKKSRACWTFARGCEACAAICCDCNLWKPRTQYTEKIFCLSIKKSKVKELFYYSIPEALHDLYTSKCKIPHNRPYDVCLWKPAERNKVPTSKQLRFFVIADTIIGNQALYFLLLICSLHQVSVKFKREKNVYNLDFAARM